MTNDVLNSTPQGRRPIGTPEQRRIDISKKRPGQLGLDNHIELVLDGDGWKEVCFADMDYFNGP